MNLYSNGLSNFFVENATGDKLLKNRKAFKRIVTEGDFTNKETVLEYAEIVRTATPEELTKYLEILNSGLNIMSAKEAFLAAQMLSIIVHNHKNLSDDQVKLVSKIFNKIDDSQIEYKNDRNAKACNDILRIVGHKIDILKEEALCGIGFNDDDVYYRTSYDIERYTTYFETAAVVYDNVQTDVSGLAKKDEVPDVKELIDYLRDFSYNKVEDDKPDSAFLISHVKDIPGYVHHILTSNKVTDDMIDGVFWLIMQTHSVLRRNGEGLDELYAALENIEDDLDNIQFSSFESFDASKNMKTFLTHIKASILTDKNNIVAKKVIPDVNPLREMGCAYFFDNIPLSGKITPEVINRLNEAAISTNALAVIQESISILNEARDPSEQTSIEYAINSKRDERKDKINIRKENREDMLKDKLEDKRRKAQEKRNKSDMPETPEEESVLKHAVSSKREEMKDRIDTRRAEREARRQDKQEYKKQLREDKRYRYKQKLDRKLQDKQERADERYANKKEMKAKIKQDVKNSVRGNVTATVEGLRSLPGTSEGWAKVNRALNMAVGAIIAGGATTLIGMGPTVGTISYVISKWAKEPAQNTPLGKSATRGEMVSNLDTQITRLEGKIRQFENEGNSKAASQLETMKSKLERSRDLIYQSAAYDGGVVR